MKTYSTKLSDTKPTWHVIDAQGQVLGRLASEVAQILKGKHHPTYAPHLYMGDVVVVVNAEKVALTGSKVAQKRYYRHSQYPGGLKTIGVATVLKQHPARVVEHAVKGMLPHSPLGRALLRKLKVYAGPEHPHQAQVRGPQAGASGSEETS
ncbi:MAG: 50S ribosomal protein L13 [Chloroflexi bacterium]|nr:50S ribosomal protein L13 [Chloroflexota bacterium]